MPFSVCKQNLTISLPKCYIYSLRNRVTYMCSMNEGRNLVNLEQLTDKTPLHSMHIQTFWSVKMLKEIQKEHCVQVHHVISV